jgi:ElaB/YqjD/DUF883 family membrane-anchored ribosome-binding protein
MSGRHAAELRALHETLQSPATGDAPADGRETSEVTVTAEESELVATLRELKDGLIAVAENADDVIITHPVASVGAAFLLGLAVGRLMRGL